MSIAKPRGENACFSVPIKTPPCSSTSETWKKEGDPEAHADNPKLRVSWRKDGAVQKMNVSGTANIDPDIGV